MTSPHSPPESHSESHSESQPEPIDLTESTSVETDIWTPRQTADYLQISEITLARWRSSGSGPAYVKLGRGANAPVRYHIADVKAYVRSLTTKANSSNFDTDTDQHSNSN